MLDKYSIIGYNVLTIKYSSNPKPVARIKAKPARVEGADQGTEAKSQRGKLRQETKSDTKDCTASLATKALDGR